MKKQIPYILSSLVLVIFSYLLSLINYELLGNINNFFKLGLLTNFENGLYDNFQVVPVYLIWIILGVFAYFLYYFLSLAYYEIYNSVLIKVAYKKPDEEIEIPKIKILRRIFIHLLIIALFLFSCLAIFALMPVSNILRNFVFESITGYLPYSFTFYLSFIPSLILWYTFTFLFSKIAIRVMESIRGENIKEEHSAI